MGYFFSQTWMWWLLAIVLAVAITWLLFRERKHKDKLEVNENRAYGERGLAGGAEAKLERKEERAGAPAGNQFDAGYEGASAEGGRLEGGRLEGDADRTRIDNEGVNIPSQHRSLKERADELKEKAEARSGRRKFF